MRTTSLTSVILNGPPINGHIALASRGQIGGLNDLILLNPVARSEFEQSEIVKQRGTGTTFVDDSDPGLPLPLRFTTVKLIKLLNIKRAATMSSSLQTILECAVSQESERYFESGNCDQRSQGKPFIHSVLGRSVTIDTVEGCMAEGFSANC